MTHIQRRFFIISAGLMFIGVTLGAFGAHALKHNLNPLQLETWETGVRYLIYQALGLMSLSLSFSLFPEKGQQNLKLCSQLLLAGIVLFSGNCFLYALTGIKSFALLVPLGGTFLLAAWGLLFTILVRLRL